MFELIIAVAGVIILGIANVKLIRMIREVNAMRREIQAGRDALQKEMQELRQS